MLSWVISHDAKKNEIETELKVVLFVTKWFQNLIYNEAATLASKIIKHKSKIKTKRFLLCVKLI